MLKLFKKDQVALNRLYKQVGAEYPVLVFPFEVSKSVSNAKFENRSYPALNVLKFVPFGDDGEVIEICIDEKTHRSTDFKNNIMLCVSLTEVPEANVGLGDIIAIPMSDFVGGAFEEVIGFTSDNNLPVSNADLEKLLK